jgi:hypothetical protein
MIFARMSLRKRIISLICSHLYEQTNKVIIPKMITLDICVEKYVCIYPCDIRIYIIDDNAKNRAIYHHRNLDIIGLHQA